MQHPACRQDWATGALASSLRALLPGLAVEVRAETASTNTVLLEHARQATGPEGLAAQPALLAAEAQTAGRGRQGRAWQALPGASLTFSLALPMAPRAAGGWHGLSLAVGLALAEALEPVADGVAPRLGLKWPNDLWLWDGPGRGRKLGGILIETAGLPTAATASPGPDGAPLARWCVVGVGLNVADQPGAPGSLQTLLPGATPPGVLSQVAPPLLRALLAFERQGFAPLQPAYGRRDLLAGQALHTSTGLAGDGAGVDARGALLLRTAHGLFTVTSGEVSVRFFDHPLPAAVAQAGPP
jgi:BirA family biotin operon repressor/biotin-[acetyl-CoA-carboxylase] ligase